MSTATTAHDVAVGVTVPYALAGLADHVNNQDLPSPSSVDIGQDVTVWLYAPAVPAWLKTAIDVEQIDHVPYSQPAWHLHTAHAVLHTSCVRVLLRWLTPVDHMACRGNDDQDCDRVICYCFGVDQACDGTVEPGCAHPGEFVCDVHRRACEDCRIDSRSEITVGWWNR